MEQTSQMPKHAHESRCSSAASDRSCLTYYLQWVFIHRDVTVEIRNLLLLFTFSFNVAKDTNLVMLSSLLLHW